MLTALVLICSLTKTPDLATCGRDTAVTVISVPSTFGNPATCFMHGQAFLAETEFGRDLAADERIKVVCAHNRGADTTRAMMQP